MEWKRLNGVIIGCEDKGMEYNLFAIYQNKTLCELYHKQLDKDKEGEKDEYVS
jgi:hypothetical protein